MTKTMKTEETRSPAEGAWSLIDWAAAEADEDDSAGTGPGKAPRPGIYGL